MVGNHCLYVLAGLVEARLRCELKLLIPAAVDIEQKVFCKVVVVGVLRVALCDQMVGAEIHALSNIEFSLTLWLKAEPANPINISTMPK